MLEEIEDDSTQSTTPSTALIGRQYVVFSSTFQVPAFYFTIHHSSSSLFRRRALT